MSDTKKNKHGEGQNGLFDRVVSILEQARGNVVRSVNSNVVQAYWMSAIRHPAGDELMPVNKQYPSGTKSSVNESIQYPPGSEIFGFERRSANIRFQISAIPAQRVGVEAGD